MMGHALSEGVLLARQRWVLSGLLGVALGVPLALAGGAASLVLWAQPMVEAATRAAPVPVLLHPNIDEQQRESWIRALRAEHPGWGVRVVSSEEIGARLTEWFPYLGDLFSDGGPSLLPPMVEITAADPEELRPLLGSPVVVAVGPRRSVPRLLEAATGSTATVLGIICALLLSSAVLLAAVWVHLELFRHRDEITIMRLVGAEEGSVRGPFLVAVTVPGLLAALLAAVGTVVTVHGLTRITTAVGMPPVTAPAPVIVTQAVLAVALPVASAWIILARHGHPEP